MKGHVNGINPEILYKCRLQSGLEIPEVKARIPKIEEIEGGRIKPTFNQIESLSKMYNVPRWVFVAKELPSDFQFEKSVTAFRQFADSSPDVFGDSKIRNLIAKVERSRKLILELSEDIGEPLKTFDLPDFKYGISIAEQSTLVRNWLGILEESLSFDDWKKYIEQKGVFVFLTSKYKGWSNIERTHFRGLSIFHNVLPIIIINDSDAKKAQLFTLLHELGHIMHKENSLDNWSTSGKEEEKWCDEFAGNVLMPSERFKKLSIDIKNIDSLKVLAKQFGVSPYAALVRLRALKIIDQNFYVDLEKNIHDEWEVLYKKQKESTGGPARNRAKEVLHQYGSIYTRILFQAYHNKEIGLHKLSKLLDLKKTSYVFELERCI